MCVCVFLCAARPLNKIPFCCFVGRRRRCAKHPLFIIYAVNIFAVFIRETGNKTIWRRGRVTSPHNPFACMLYIKRVFFFWNGRGRRCAYVCLRRRRRRRRRLICRFPFAAMFVWWQKSFALPRRVGTHKKNDCLFKIMHSWWRRRRRRHKKFACRRRIGDDDGDATLALFFANKAAKKIARVCGKKQRRRSICVY